MSDFQTVRKRGPATTSSSSGSSSSAPKYPEKYQTLLEMGFDSASIVKALDSTNGDLESATAVLLGETVDAGVAATVPAALPPMQVVGKHPSSSNGNGHSQKVTIKPDIKEVHNKFMASYKTQKCKEKANHDKRMCVYWHTKGDRRRNPFEIMYTCTECPDSSETVTCPGGDTCLKAHNMLERMFHPELFKISMCQRGPNGSHCERGNLCAFAHSEEDHRVPMSHTLGKVTANSTTPLVQLNFANNASSSEPIQPGKTMSDSRLLDNMQDKLIRLIKCQGLDGIISSELPKRFYDVYNERLELTDEAGEKFRIKDLLLSHPGITVSMHKGVQPKYVYEDPSAETSTSSASTSSQVPVNHTNLGSFAAAAGASKAPVGGSISTLAGASSYSAIISNNANNTSTQQASTTKALQQQQQLQQLQQKDKKEQQTATGVASSSSVISTTSNASSSMANESRAVVPRRRGPSGPLSNVLESSSAATHTPISNSDNNANKKKNSISCDEKTSNEAYSSLADVDSTFTTAPVLGVTKSSFQSLSTDVHPFNSVSTDASSVSSTSSGRSHSSSLLLSEPQHSSNSSCSGSINSSTNNSPSKISTAPNLSLGGGVDRPRRRGPDSTNPSNSSPTSSLTNNASNNNQNPLVPVDAKRPVSAPVAPPGLGAGATSTGNLAAPSANGEAESAKIADVARRLAQTTATNNSLLQQIAELKGQLSSKSTEYDAQNTELQTTLKFLVNAKSNSDAPDDDAESIKNELETHKIEIEWMKQKMLERDAEYTSKCEESLKKDLCLSSLQQEKAADLNHFRMNIGQIEMSLIDMQRKESIYINEISLHQTINESSRARDELTKFVNLIKMQLNTKISNEAAKAKQPQQQLQAQQQPGQQQHSSPSQQLNQLMGGLNQHPSGANSNFFSMMGGINLSSSPSNSINSNSNNNSEPKLLSDLRSSTPTPDYNPGSPFHPPNNGNNNSNGGGNGSNRTFLNAAPSFLNDESFSLNLGASSVPVPMSPSGSSIASLQSASKQSSMPGQDSNTTASSNGSTGNKGCGSDIGNNSGFRMAAPPGVGGFPNFNSSLMGSGSLIGTGGLPNDLLPPRGQSLGASTQSLMNSVPSDLGAVGNMNSINMMSGMGNGNMSSSMSNGGNIGMNNGNSMNNIGGINNNNNINTNINASNANGTSNSANSSTGTGTGTGCSLPGCMMECMFICSACNKAGYCGQDHQRKHWESHVNDCNAARFSGLGDLSLPN